MTELSAAEVLRGARSFGPLPGCPAGAIIRQPWPGPTQRSRRLRGCEEKPDEAWSEAVAPYVLNEPEWRIWRRLTKAGMRRRWMRGRVAAKDAVRLLLLERYGLAASMETLGILPDEQGRPHVACSALTNGGEGLCVSIAHCGNTSVALATERSPACRAVGIDVASFLEDHEGLAEGGFAAAEMALLDGCTPAERNGWLLLLWCAKEAVGKALGVGLMGDPLNYVVRAMHRERQTVDVLARLATASADASPTPRQVEACVGRHGGMAYAVAALEER